MHRAAPLALASFVAACTATSGSTVDSDDTGVDTTCTSNCDDTGTPVDTGAAPDTAVPVDAPSCNAGDPRTVPLTIGVDPDNADTLQVAAINLATKSIHMIVYELEAGGIYDALLAKTNAKLDVQVILDQSEMSTNQAAYDGLTAAGAKVQWSDPKFTFTHAKSFVVDGKYAVISTGNFSGSQISKERNYIARDDDPADVASLLAIIDADLAGKTPDLSCTRLLVSPINSRPRLLDLINGATKSILVESMEFADADVRNAIASKVAAKLDVRVIVEDPKSITDNANAATYMKTYGIPGRYLSNPYIHVKSIIVDGVRAYFGSENLSFTSLDQNREVGIILEDTGPLATMTATFEKDWAIAKPLF